MSDWLDTVGAALPAQLRAAVLTAIAFALWFASLRMAISRHGDVTRWFVYGIMGLSLTLLGIAALDNGASWFFLEIILSLFACLGFLIELRALRSAERLATPEYRPSQRKPIRENP